LSTKKALLQPEVHRWSAADTAATRQSPPYRRRLNDATATHPPDSALDTRVGGTV